MRRWELIVGIVGALASALSACAESPAKVDGTKPADPWPCPVVAECSNIYADGLFSLVFDAPSSVELQGMQDGQLVGYDGISKQFIVYSTSGYSGLPTIDEQYRFDAKYDRMLFEADGFIIACAGARCDLFPADQPFKQRLPIAHVPDEVVAQSSSRGCVGGQGIMCFDDASKQWSWMVPPAILEAPIAFFLRLGDAEFLVVDTNGASWLATGDSVRPFDTGAHEPLVALAPGSAGEQQQWVGRTRSGSLVVGSLMGGRECTGVRADAIGSGLFKQADTLVMYGQGFCSKQSLPPNMSGIAFTRCGYSRTTLAFDAHRVFSTAVICGID